MIAQLKQIFDGTIHDKRTYRRRFSVDVIDIAFGLSIWEQRGTIVPSNRMNDTPIDEWIV